MNIIEAVKNFWFGSRQPSQDDIHDKKITARENHELLMASKRVESERLDMALERAKADKEIKDKRLELKKMGVGKSWSAKTWAFIIVGVIFVIVLIAKAC